MRVPAAGRMRGPALRRGVVMNLPWIWRRVAPGAGGRSRGRGRPGS